MAELLLNAGADVNAASDRFRNTPLLAAVKNRHDRLARFLLRYCADKVCF